MIIEDVLKPEYQDLADDYDLEFGDGSCYCSATSMPPCSWCESGGCHPGHPEALANTPEAWENPLIAEVRRIHEETQCKK